MNNTGTATGKDRPRSTGETLNQRIVNWANGRRGQAVFRIGSNGARTQVKECWDLPDVALRQAGALSSHDIGPTGKNADYAWGDRIQLKDVIPGDILQFRNHQVDIMLHDSLDFDSEDAVITVKERPAQSTQSRGHHSAIVQDTTELSAGILKTLELHVRSDDPTTQDQHPLEHVQLKTLYIGSTEVGPTTARMRICKRADNNYVGWRNKSCGPKDHMELATVTSTRIITVTGKIWAYRPKPRP